MLLNEIFDNTNIPVEWHNGYATFDLGEYTYIIQTMSMEEGDQIHQKLSQFPVTDNTYFFAFAADNNNNGGMPIDTDTGARDSIKIFSVVLQELQKFVAKSGADMLYFGCDANHPGRRRLYQKMVDKYTKSNHWVVVGEADALFFGENKHIWVVKR
jgi:hypothetical protein